MTLTSMTSRFCHISTMSQWHCRRLNGSFADGIQHKSADTWQYFQLGASNEQLSIAEYNASNTLVAN